eukprot:scaffold39766_cov46-Phaeocystis_antarctica.AAC.1
MALLSVFTDGRFATARPRLVAGLLHQKGALSSVVRRCDPSLFVHPDRRAYLTLPYQARPRPRSGPRVSQQNSASKHNLSYPNPTPILPSSYPYPTRSIPLSYPTLILPVSSTLTLP